MSRFYGGAKRNVDFFDREAAADGLIEFGYYGDWLQLEHTDKPQVTATAQIMATSHLVEMASHLQLAADVSRYNASLQAQRASYHARSVLGSWVGVRAVSTFTYSQPRPAWLYPKILVLTELPRQVLEPVGTQLPRPVLPSREY